MARMHAARPASSPRLRAVLEVLSDGAEHSSWDLTVKAQVTAPGTAVSELRAAGAVIACRQAVEDGRRRFYYRMTKEPDA